jgi:hypothetical protein
MCAYDESEHWISNPMCSMKRAAVLVAASAVLEKCRIIEEH